jgi:Ran GTPase-activating protein (RanGAP) involved in mRNA processing and transport
LAAFSPENRLGGVKYLDLRGNELPPSSGQEVAAILSKKSSLSFLDLTGNQLGAKGCELISRSLASATLTSLSLSANSMGNEGVMYIARSLGPALTTLSLSLNFLGDDAIDYLAPRLLSPCNITHLDLSWNHIGSGGARELSKVLEQHTCTITTLNLEGNSLGPEGTVLLMAALHNNTTLTHLILATNNFRKDGAKAVADLLKRSPTITTLNIGKNGIKGIYLLFVCPHYRVSLVLPSFLSLFYTFTHSMHQTKEHSQLQTR